MFYMEKACIAQSLGFTEMDPPSALHYPQTHQSVARRYWEGAKRQAGELVEGKGVVVRSLLEDTLKGDLFDCSWLLLGVTQMVTVIMTSCAIPVTGLGLLRGKVREELCLLRLGVVSEIWRKQSKSRTAQLRDAVVLRPSSSQMSAVVLSWWDFAPPPCREAAG